MHEIPAVKDTDVEDVVWGLQTAESLWRRGERIDALVWLRRAAQSAGDANDDERAVELARFAAELTEWVAQSDGPSIPPSATEPDIDVAVSMPPVQAMVGSVTVRPATEALTTLAPDAIVEEPASRARPETSSVPPGEAVHKDIYDPWADERISAPGRPPLPPPPARRASIVDLEEQGDVITSVRPEAPSRPPEDVLVPPPVRVPSFEAAPPARPRAPPPLPPRAKPPVPKPAPPEPTPPATTAPPPAAVVTAPPPPVTAPVAPPPPALDLDAVEAFSDLPDDARASFAAAAKLHDLAEGEEIGAFALAYVVSGAFDVAATVVDAPAVRLPEGSVLRARGTTDENVPIRLICAQPKGLVAVWSDAEVDEAFRTIPWVEEDLRAAADRVQTLVGITIGPLGERLDGAIREQILARLTMRRLLPGEIIAKEREPVPGLLLVGIGELELVKGDAVVGTVSSGDFLFASEVLGAGASPATARAAPGGALVMFGARAIAQELLVTCPPLLELFAGM
jgi:hypothetical protein